MHRPSFLVRGSASVDGHAGNGCSLRRALRFYRNIRGKGAFALVKALAGVMQAPLKDKNDIKIFILYLLRHIDYPLDFTNINDIVVQDGFVNYFDFAECFAELLDTGNIQEIKDGDEELYVITDQGIRVADTLDSRLLNMLKDKSLKSALRLLSFKKRGAQIKCEEESLPDGRFILHCIVIDHHEERMHVKVLLDDRIQVEKMKYNFNDKPEIVYRGVLALLSGEVNYLIQ